MWEKGPCPAQRRCVTHCDEDDEEAFRAFSSTHPGRGTALRSAHTARLCGRCAARAAARSATGRAGRPGTQRCSAQTTKTNNKQLSHRRENCSSKHQHTINLLRQQNELSLCRTRADRDRTRRSCSDLHQVRAARPVTPPVSPSFTPSS